MRFLLILLFAIGLNAQDRADRFTRLGEEFYPSTIPGILHLWYNDYNGASETDGTAVSQWNDLIGSADATAGTAPEIDTSTGNVQLYFNGTDRLIAQADGGDMDFTPGTDTFSVVIKWGGQQNDLDSGCWFCKSTGTSSTRQYQINSSTGTMQIYIGGQTVDGAAGALDNNSFAILIVTASAVNYWHDGVKEIDNITLTGTATNTQPVEIGDRQNGAAYNPEGNIQWIAVYNSDISAYVTELNSRYDEN